jgi:hypothetical protein
LNLFLVDREVEIKKSGQFSLISTQLSQQKMAKINPIK